MINVMGTLLLFMSGLLVLADENRQSPSETVKAQLCRFYVAYFNMEQGTNYYERLLLARLPDMHWEGPHPYFMLSINNRDPDNVHEFNFTVMKYQRRFLDYDVFFIYPSTTHALPYKLGINDQFEFVRFRGFIENSHISSDTSAFLSYDDGFSFNSTDIPTGDHTRVSEFIYDWIQLTQFDDHPNFIKLLSNEYTLIDQDVLGSCVTVELKQSYDVQGVMIYKEWKYKIPEYGQPVLKLHTQREDTDRSVFDDASSETGGSLESPWIRVTK